MKVAKNISEVTPQYIRDSLKAQYGPRSWVYSNRLVAHLAHDAKKKQDNLRWLFGDDLRIRLSVSPEEVFKDLIASNSMAERIHSVITAMGATTAPEDFIKGFCHFNKNRVRIQAVLEQAKDHADKLPGHIVHSYGSRRYIGDPSNKYMERHTRQIDLSNTITVGQLVVSGAHVCRLTDINQSLSDKFVRDHQMDKVLEQTSSQDIILSLDVNDFVTCSTQSGACRSCMRIDGEYHLGWQMHYRSDFSIIMFTHSSKNEFEKTGRCWLTVRMTEGGMPYIKPFYKVGKTYGTINQTHRRLVNEFLQGRISEVFGVGEPKKETSSDWPRATVSPNMSGGSGQVGTPGYFDRHVDDDAAFYVYPSDIPAWPANSHNYRYGPSCIFPYPDPLNLEGYPTGQTNFGQQDVCNFVTGFRQEPELVTCIKTGQEVWTDEAVRTDDGWVSHAFLLAAADMSRVVEPVQDKTVVKEEAEDLAEVDVEDF